MLSLIVGALISIPLSVLANTLTPRFQSWNARRNQAAAAKQAATDEQFRNRIDYYRQNPVPYQAFVHVSLVRIAVGLFGCVLGMLGGLIVSFAGDGTIFERGVADTALIATILLFAIVQRNLREASRVAGALRKVGPQGDRTPDDADNNVI